MVYNCIKNIQYWFIPPTCQLCGSEAQPPHDLCLPCRQDLPYLQHGCPVCARLLPPGAHGMCGHCQQNPPPFHYTFSLCHYRYPVDRLITNMKYHGKLPAARLLGQLMAETLQPRTAPLPQLLIPVPLYRWRMWQRGYNQATELARELGRQLNIPVETRACRRIKNTLAQSSLPARQRRSNVRNAFCLHKDIVANHVALVDDVMTTGHTLTELATILPEHVRIVEVWVAARTDT
jgi:ComF family protein